MPRTITGNAKTRAIALTQRTPNASGNAAGHGQRDLGRARKSDQVAFPVRPEEGRTRSLAYIAHGSSHRPSDRSEVQPHFGYAHGRIERSHEDGSCQVAEDSRRWVDIGQRVTIGIINVPPTAPVTPTREPTSALPSTMYGSMVKDAPRQCDQHG